MAEIEILLPTVQYGNVRITGTPEEFGVELTAPGAIGEMAATYLNLFTQGFRVGAERDVDYHPAEAVQPDDMTAAVTAVSELGATVVEQYNHDGPGDVDNAHLEQSSDQDLPWEKDVKASRKPWENKGAPKAPAKAAGNQPASINW